MDYSTYDLSTGSPSSTNNNSLASASSDSPHRHHGSHHHEHPPPLSLNMSTLAVSSEPVSPASASKEEDMMSVEASPVDRDGTPPDSGGYGDGMMGGPVGGLGGILGPGKTMPTNNFVTKLYQCAFYSQYYSNPNPESE